MGNLAPQKYKVDKNPTATGGFGFFWKVYDGIDRATQEQVSIFVCDRKHLTAQIKNKSDVEAVVAHYRHSVKKLMSYRHPCILNVVELIPESNGSFGVVTERVQSSLANTCKDFSGFSNEQITEKMRSTGLSQFEIAYGVLSMFQGINFLHERSIVHGNISIENVYLTQNGKWKLAGMGFVQKLDTPVSTIEMQPFCSLNPSSPVPAFVPLPTLGFCSPEMCEPPHMYGLASDVFSLGAVIFQVFSGTSTLGSTKTWELTLSQYAHRLTHCAAPRGQVFDEIEKVPEPLRAQLLGMLHGIPHQRPSISSFINNQFFAQGPVKVLSSIDKLLEISDPREQAVALSQLPEQLEQFPSRVLRDIVLPMLLQLVNNPILSPYAIPSVVRASSKLELRDFTTHVVPKLIPVIGFKDPPQTLLQLAQHAEILVKLGDETFVTSYIIPMVGRALEAFRQPDCMLAALKRLPAILDECIVKLPVSTRKSMIKNMVLPRLKRCAQSSPTMPIRVQTLISFARLIETKELDVTVIESEVVGIIQQCLQQKPLPPAIYMCCLGALDACSKIVRPQFLAERVIPILVAVLYTPGINSSQLETSVKRIQGMLSTVHTARKDELDRMPQTTTGSRAVENSSKSATRSETVSSIAASLQSSIPLPSMESGPNKGTNNRTSVSDPQPFVLQPAQANPSLSWSVSSVEETFKAIKPSNPASYGATDSFGSNAQDSLAMLNSTSASSMSQQANGNLRVGTTPQQQSFPNSLNSFSPKVNSNPQRSDVNSISAPPQPAMANSFGIHSQAPSMVPKMMNTSQSSSNTSPFPLMHQPLQPTVSVPNSTNVPMQPALLSQQYISTSQLSNTDLDPFASLTLNSEISRQQPASQSATKTDSGFTFIG